MRNTSSVRARRRDRKVMPPTLRYRSTSNSTSRNRTGGRSRMRMRPWLELLLDTQKCSILRWEDKEQQKFSIAWRHASSHGFEYSRHGDLFYMWAEHTGKVKRNTRDNHSSNKSTFRCALHSLKDCIELTKTGDKRGEGAKRTYQFIDPSHHLYDRKRKKGSQRGNKFQMLLKEEVSVSSPEFQEESSHNSEYLNAEAHSAAMNIATSSAGAPEPSNESAALFSSISSDFLIPPRSSSPLVTTDFMNYPNTDVTGSNDLDPHFESHTDFLTTPKFYTELQANGVVSLMIDPMKCSAEHIADVTCKEEPVTPKIPDFAALDIPDIYEDLDSIKSRSLCCGGNVKVKQNKQETLSQPEFEIDYSLIRKLPPQQLLPRPPHQLLPSERLFLPSQEQLLPQQPLLPPERHVAESSLPEYECPIAVTCVDITTDHPGVTVLEQSIEDSIFQYNQNEDSNSRVLIQLQPMIDDTSYAAMEEVPYDEFNNVWCHDIFSIGAF